MLDIQRVASFADYFVICTGMNARHLQALAEEMDQSMSRQGGSLRRREGTAESGWVLLDFGDVIVHLFAAQQREQYALEQLWSQALPVVRVL